ncbi:MAG: hypothetical protein KME47_16600 [Nodosilinea sp. WJT8-NPBG4]|jgi:site-specific recombinase XerC|nr:hypothetical protein [Nodosilinea sp. WJT8-NPBG4]
MTEYTFQEFEGFLDWLADKGKVKVNTVRGWKSAASKILSILDEDKLQDLRNVDVEEVCLRFANKNGKDLSTASLKTYKSRLKTSLDEFFAWRSNPMGYKPNASYGVRKERQADSSNGLQNKEANPDSNNEVVASEKSNVSVVTFPIPLRSGLIVKLTDLPIDLTEEEAEKISMVVKALASK